MPYPTADDTAARPSRIPRLPNPPSSRRSAIARRPALHAATTGSPCPAAYTPASRNLTSPTPESKIPTAEGKQLTTHQKGHEQEQQQQRQQRHMSNGIASDHNANTPVENSLKHPNSHELEQADQSTASAAQSTPHQDSPHGGFTWRSSSEHWEKQMPHESTLRIHRDAPDVLFGDPSQMPKDLPKPAASRSSFRTSLGTLAQQTKSSIGLALSSSTDLPVHISTREAATIPVIISPIRSMQRQGVRNFSTPTRRPARPAETSDDVAPVPIEMAAVLDQITPAVPTENVVDTDSDDELMEFWVALHETAPPEKKRGVGFITATTSFAGRVSERKSMSDLKLKAKRSLHSLFAKSEAGSSEPKRSIATSGCTLAKRISRNFSRVHIPSVPANELRNLELLSRRQSALTTVAAVSSSNANPEPLAHYTVQTAATVNHIVASIAAATTTGREAHRLASIAGALLDMAEIARENAEMRQMALAAQLEVLAGSERLSHVRARLETLLEGEFADPTMGVLMDRLKAMESLV